MTRLRRALLCSLVALQPGCALAHGGTSDTVPEWSFDPYVIALLVLSAGFYGAGAIRLWGHAGLGRGIRLWQAACYATGWLLLAGALLSPLHWLGEHLFSAHMVEHEIVMACAAPLLALSRPIGAFLWALPAPVRRRLGSAGHRPLLRRPWRLLTAPLSATLLHGAAIWLWHAPPLFEAALRSEPLHRLQHISFLVTALAFWWALVRRAERGAAVLHLFATMTHMTLLGALITFAGHVLYRQQTQLAATWGLTPMEDQQLAGLLMWVPAGTVYAGAALAFAALWIRHSSRKAPYGLTA
jgi:cytochrome c oxidase assembly factor CtaG